MGYFVGRGAKQVYIDEEGTWDNERKTRRLDPDTWEPIIGKPDKKFMRKELNRIKYQQLFKKYNILHLGNPTKAELIEKILTEKLGY